jgi:hypothetical protein
VVATEVAEREGFEPSVEGLPLHVISSPKPRPPEASPPYLTWILTRLEEENLLVRDKGGRHITQPAAPLDRWLVGVADKLRPRLLIGKYRPFTKDPQELQTLVAQRLGEDQEWAWGGMTAAYNLTQHYRGEHTILHIRDVPAHFQERTRTRKIWLFCWKSMRPTMTNVATLRK